MWYALDQWSTHVKIHTHTLRGEELHQDYLCFYDWMHAFMCLSLYPQMYTHTKTLTITLFNRSRENSARFINIEFRLCEYYWHEGGASYLRVGRESERDCAEKTSFRRRIRQMRWRTAVDHMRIPWVYRCSQEGLLDLSTNKQNNRIHPLLDFLGWRRLDREPQ